MSKTPRPPSITPGTGKVPAPVRVKLKRVSCNHAIPYPPDGQAREWWQRLKDAFGTASSAFVEASLYQLIAAARCRDRKKALPNARWRNQHLADLRARATATTSMAGTP